MRDESAFLQALLADPTDDDLRLVYADWLEEHGQPAFAPRVEFLRLTAEQVTNPGSKSQQKARLQRLQQLAAGLETDWLAVASRLPLENCQKKRREAETRRGYSIRFDYLCHRRWEDLNTTEDQTVRFCDGCRQQVHYCDTIMEARKHAKNGHCIAVDLGVIRREDDLAPPRLMMLGWPSPESVRQEEERVRPDPVSAERERRKQRQLASQHAKRRRARRVSRRYDGSPVRPSCDRGERVMVRDGTFAGMEGVVRELREDRGAVQIELTVFGRTVPVELEYWQVEPIPAEG
jgi:uncharacterized protein (TIGR02996 family)